MRAMRRGVGRVCVDGRARVRCGCARHGEGGIARGIADRARDPTAEGYRGRDARDGGRGCVCVRVRRRDACVCVMAHVTCGTSWGCSCGLYAYALYAYVRARDVD